MFEVSSLTSHLYPPDRKRRMNKTGQYCHEAGKSYVIGGYGLSLAAAMDLDLDRWESKHPAILLLKMPPRGTETRTKAEG